MTLIGVGIDLVDIPRLQLQLEQTPGLAERLFAPEELGLSIESKAARFAVKEALAKALGDPRKLSWVEIQLGKNELGKPELVLIGGSAVALQNRGVLNTSVSISHTETTAAAVVILEG